MIETLITFVILANAVRTTPVVPDLELTNRAQARAEYLCEHNQWSHDGWLTSFEGLPYTTAGENLAKGFNSPEEMEEAWLASPTHRYNLLNPRYEKMGIGQSCNITVQLFTN